VAEYDTDTKSAQNLSNIVRFGTAEGTYYWFAYRHQNSGNKDLYTARSKDFQTWQAFKMYSDKYLGISAHTDNRSILVVVGDEMFLFWMDSTKDRLLATKYGPDRNNPLSVHWARHVSCRDTNGKGIPERGDYADAALGAVASGERILVSVNYGKSIKHFVFDPGAWTTEWRASAESEILPSHFDVTPAIKSFGKNQALTLFSVGPTATFAAHAVKATGSDGVQRYLILQLKLRDEATWWGPVETPLDATCDFAAWWADPDAGRGEAMRMTLTTDPGGRVVAGFTRSDLPYRRVLSTGKQPGVWGPEAPLATFAVSEYPVVFYNFEGPEWVKTADQKVAQERSVTRWSLLRKSGKPTTCVDGEASGCVRKILRAEELNLTTGSTTRTLYVQGYIDGPPPVFDGMVNPSSEVTYAVTSATAASDDVETNVSYGVKSEGNLAPAIGMGGMWEASFSVGVGAAWGSEVTKSLTQNTRFQLQVGPDRTFLQKGLARCSELVLCRDAYQYLPDGETPVEDGPTFTSIYIAFQPDNKFEYRLGTVTVGDLDSYTVDKWNERMSRLDRYEGKNYIDQIVKPRAVRFKNNQYSLSDMWTPGSPVDGVFESTNQRYVSSSMKLDASVFTGVGGKFFGAEASFMSGWTTSIATTSKSVESEGFGLSVVIDGNAGGGIARYRASTLLLEASNDWIYELIQLQPDQSKSYTIDPGASCWKVMYVVDSIEYDELLEALALPQGLLDELQAAGLRTTQDALRSLGLAFPSDLHGRIAADEVPEHAVILAALRAWDERRNVYPEVAADSSAEPASAEAQPLEEA
jgi:hypothetical protein